MNPWCSRLYEISLLPCPFTTENTAVFWEEASRGLATTTQIRAKILAKSMSAMVKVFFIIIRMEQTRTLDILFLQTLARFSLSKPICSLGTAPLFCPLFSAALSRHREVFCSGERQKPKFCQRELLPCIQCLRLGKCIPRSLF